MISGEKAAENPLLDCAIKIFLYLFKQLWCLTKNVPIERIGNGAIFTKGQGDTQFSVNANMKIRSTEISYKSRSQKLAFRSTTAYISITLCLGSIVRCFQFVRVSSPSGKGASYEPPLPSEISAFEPPSPSEFPVTFRGGGGGMDVFWNHTFYNFYI